jgi:hypothetical protein
VGLAEPRLPCVAIGDDQICPLDRSHARLDPQPGYK